jgi:hypothetical protein
MPLLLGERVWVPGHSPVSGGAGQLGRQGEVLAAVRKPPPAIALHFRVTSYTRRGHYFDMESLGYVVLAAWRHDLKYSRPVKLDDLYKPSSVWLTMATGADGVVGVEIAHEPAPEPQPEAVELDVAIAQPPTLSVRGTSIPELIDCLELSASPWLGLELTFGSQVDIAEFGFKGPIKSLIDAMYPVLGRDNRAGPADHRLHDLRIRSDGSGDGSVRARFWYDNESAGAL